MTPQSSTLGVLITALHDHHLCKTFDRVYTRINILLYELKSKPHLGQSLRGIIYANISARFYPPPGSDHHKLIFLGRFHVITHRQVHLCDKPEKNNELYTVQKYSSV